MSFFSCLLGKKPQPKAGVMFDEKGIVHTLANGSVEAIDWHQLQQVSIITNRTGPRCGSSSAMKVFDLFSLRLLLREALRCSVFFRPNWHGLPASSWLIALLTGAHILLMVMVGRMMIVGPATFYWQAISSVWFGIVALILTQKLMEAQPALLAQRLAEVLPQRPGVTDLYTLTFAPYASEDVFHNETAMVTQVMAKRFDAAGRSLQLVNHVDTVQQLPSEGTLVMTAADAKHTSYGCGRKSKLTFFGRAMYDEQLRNTTRSFEAAHAAARTVIKQREQEAGKDDGYSNPQIKVGSAIKPHLARLQARLQGG